MDTNHTVKFSIEKEQTSVEDILKAVYASLTEKGYDPINQLVGYIISGDPTYITSHKNARYLIRRFERDEILEELVKVYIDKLEEEKNK